MRAFFRYFPVFFLLGIFLVGNCRAQQPLQTPSRHGFLAVSHSGPFQSIFSQSLHPASWLNPEGQDMAYNYFDSTLPFVDWQCNGNYGDVFVMYLGQRITIETDFGYVDSVTVTLDSITQ